MSDSTLSLPFGDVAPEVSPASLLAELSQRGARIETRDGGLSIDAPRGAIGDLIGDLQKFKPQLLNLLRPLDGAGAPNSPEMPAEGAPTVPAPDDAQRLENGPQTENLSVGGAAEIRELARAVLQCIRPNGGFDFGKVKPYWHAANELTGQNMTSPELANFARSILDDPSALLSTRPQTDQSVQNAPDQSIQK